MFKNDRRKIIELNKQARARREQGLYVIEGVRMFREAPVCDTELIVASRGFLADRENKKLLEGRQYEEVEDSVFSAISATKSPQGILCVMRIQKRDFREIQNMQKPLFVVLEDVQDPGNVGTILRTGEAAGVDGVFLTKGCADLYNPKTIRSTMGSIFRMPYYEIEDMDVLMDYFADRKIVTCAAHLGGDRDYTAADYTRGCALLIGNEGNGLSEALSRRADVLVKIPMCGSVESLNAAMAAGVLMFEAARQRRMI